MGFRPRPYQSAALRSLQYYSEGGGKNALIALPTGTGKTVIGLTGAQQFFGSLGRTLWIANREVLVAQPYQKALDIWPDAGMGIVQAEKNEPGAQHIVFASIQTLAQLDAMGNLYRLNACGQFGLVILDEAHHATSPIYMKVLAALRCGQPGGPLVLGLTATPDRADGKPLDSVFDRVIFKMSVKDAVVQGYLCRIAPPVLVRIKGLRLRPIPVTNNDFVGAELGKAVDNSSIAEQVADAYVNHANGRRAAIFTVYVDQAVKTYKALKQRGVPAAWVSGNTSQADFERAIKGIQDGSIKAICNANFLTEGWDEPMIDCVINARPTKSRGLYTQIVGRGTRLCEDLEDKNLLIIDTIGEDSDETMKASDIFGPEIMHGMGPSPIQSGSAETIRPSCVVSWKKLSKTAYEATAPNGIIQVRVARRRDTKWDLFLKWKDRIGVVGTFFNREIAIGEGAERLRRLGDVSGS